MQTLMEERIKQAFAEWKKADQQPQEESNMITKPRSNLSQQLLTYITAHPGVTGAELRKVVQQKFPDTPVSYVPACLKNLFDGFHVRRNPVPNNENQFGRSTYAYYALSEEERMAERNRPKSRVMKVKKPKAVQQEDTGITTLVPTKRHATNALEVGPTTISISIQTSNGVSYSLSLPDAKYIYTQLNQIFGATR